MCSGLWLERDFGKPVPELLADAAFVERYVVNLALGLKACIMILNPARIVIGGGMAKAGEALFGPLRKDCAAGLPIGRLPGSTWFPRLWVTIPCFMAHSS